MKKPFVLISSLLLSAFALHAQSFEKFYEGGYQEKGQSIQRTLDGGFILSGSTTDAGLDIDDAYLVKTDGAGNVQWTKTIGDTVVEYVGAIVQTTDSGYAFVGTYTQEATTPETDIWLSRVSKTGDSLWHKIYGGVGNDHGYDLKLLSNGDLLIGGGLTVNFNNAFTERPVVIRSNSTGTKLWQTSFETEVQIGHINSLIYTSTNDIVGVGEALDTTTVGPVDFLLVKLAANGSMKWTKVFGGSTSERFNSIVEASDGGYIACGEIFINGQNDVFVMKMDTAGNEIWRDTLGGPARDVAESVVVLANGNILITGSTESIGNGNSDLYLLRLNAAGDSLWAAAYGGGGTDEGASLVALPNSGFAALGSTRSLGNGTYNFYLLAGDSTGCIPQRLELIHIGGPAYCGDDSVELKLAGDYSNYLWSTGASDDSIIVSMPGDYSAMVTLNNGCQAITDTITLIAYPAPPTPVITQLNDTILECSVSDAIDYKWYKDSVLVSTVDSHLFRPNFYGLYAVEITDSNGCTARSAEFDYQEVGVNILTRSSNIQLYPNPMDKIAKLTFSNPQGHDVKVELFSIGGKLCATYGTKGEELMIEREGLSAGLYLLRISKGETQQYLKLAVE